MAGAMVMADTDHDGQVDLAVSGVDVDADATYDLVHVAADTDADGQVDLTVTAIDIDGDPAYEILRLESDVDDDGLVDVAVTSLDWSEQAPLLDAPFDGDV